MPTDFTPADTAILLVDHQPGVVRMIKSVPAAVLTANAATLAKLGNDLAIPLVITSTREDMSMLGTTLHAIQQEAPAAYEKRIRRGGSLNAFAEPAFVDAVAATGRRNLVIAGVLTDVCLYHSVRSALDAGYSVKIVADACGTSSVLADDVTYARLRDLGAIVTTTFGIIFELYPDLGTAEGKQAETIAATSIVKGPVATLLAAVS